MANFHSRSNSFPSTSHPVVDDFEDHLRWLRTSEASSTSATSICANLASLRDLHNSINNLIQMASVQQVLVAPELAESWVNELVEGSLGLVDLCEFSRDIVRLTKEPIQELESSIRRNRGETSTVDNINVYAASRKKIIRRVNKYIKNLKSLNKNSSLLQDKGHDIRTITVMLKETEALCFSVLKSVLKFITEEKGRFTKGLGLCFASTLRPPVYILR